MTNAQHQTEVAIIGAGPVGLFAVFECGMLGLRCHVIDALAIAGGQCSALYPEKPIYDIPAYPRILAGDLIERLREQAAPFDPHFHLAQQVTAMTPLTDGGWRLSTSRDTAIRARAVIVAAGVGAFGPNRPPLAGIQTYEGRPEGEGVHYLVGRREAYRGRRVVIAGGGDSAVDWALSLVEVAASVAIVHRRGKFRAAPDSVRMLVDAALRAGGQVLRSDIPPGLPPAFADPEAMMQVLAHLLQNAAGVSPEGGEILVTAQLQQPAVEGDPGCVVLSVTDTGEGIPPEDLGRVFQRARVSGAVLVRGIADTSGNLALVRAMVEAQRGRVWVDSQLGHGSTFTVLLPAAAPEAPPVSRPEPVA